MALISSRRSRRLGCMCCFTGLISAKTVPWKAFGRLLGSEALHGVDEGRLQRLDADDQQGNKNCEKAGRGKYPPADMDTIGKFLQPAVHRQQGDGYGHDKGNTYQ